VRTVVFSVSDSVHDRRRILSILLRPATFSHRKEEVSCEHLRAFSNCLEMQLACSDIDHYKLNCVLYYVTDGGNVEEKNPATVMGHCCYGSSS